MKLPDAMKMGERNKTRQAFELAIIYRSFLIKNRVLDYVYNQYRKI